MNLIKILFVYMIILGIVWIIFEKKRMMWTIIKDKIESIQANRIALGLFCFVLIVETPLIFLRKLPFVADEVYSLSGASFFAGYDWSSYMSLHKFYNFGYTMLLAPIYKLLTNPVSVYRMMLFANVVLHGITILIVFYIAYRKLHFHKMESIVVAIISTCNSITFFFRGFVYNELPLAFIVWMTVLLLLELIEAGGKKRILLSILLGMVTAYAYSIHSRCLIIYGTLVVFVLLYLIRYKKCIMQPVSFATAFCVCIYLEKLLLQYVQKNLYRVGLDSHMSNTAEQVVTSTSRYEVLTSLAGIKKIILNFFSLAGAMSIETGGLITIVTVAVLCFLFKGIKKTNRENTAIFVLTVFSTVSLWGMVACVALLGASNNYPRFLAYTRYMAPFIGPFLLLGLWILKNQKKLNYKYVIGLSGILTGIVGAVYVFYSYPIFKGTSMKGNASLYFFMAFSRYAKQTKFSKNVFAIAIMLLIGFTMIQLFLYCRKQFVAFCMVAIIFSAVLFWCVEKRQCEPASQRRYEVCDETYEFVHRDLKTASAKLYCIGSETYRKGVLVTLYDEAIEFDRKQIQTGEGTIILSNKLDTLQEFQPEYIIVLDDNEWAGIWGDTLYNSFKGNYEKYETGE